MMLCTRPCIWYYLIKVQIGTGTQQPVRNIMQIKHKLFFAKNAKYTIT